MTLQHRQWSGWLPFVILNEADVTFSDGFSANLTAPLAALTQLYWRGKTLQVHSSAKITYDVSQYREPDTDPTHFFRWFGTLAVDGTISAPSQPAERVVWPNSPEIGPFRNPSTFGFLSTTGIFQTWQGGTLLGSIPYTNRTDLRLDAHLFDLAMRFNGTNSTGMVCKSTVGDYKASVYLLINLAETDGPASLMSINPTGSTMVAATFTVLVGGFTSSPIPLYLPADQNLFNATITGNINLEVTELWDA